MSFKVVKSRAEGPASDPVILDSKIIDSGLDSVDARDVMYYEIQAYKKAGAQVIETYSRAIVVDGSDRATHVIDIFEEN